jgi:hypothetical protein
MACSYAVRHYFKKRKNDSHAFCKYCGAEKSSVKKEQRKKLSYTQNNYIRELFRDAEWWGAKANITNRTFTSLEMRGLVKFVMSVPRSKDLFGLSGRWILTCEGRAVGSKIAIRENL